MTAKVLEITDEMRNWVRMQKSLTVKQGSVFIRFYEGEKYFVGPQAEPRVLTSLRRLYTDNQNVMTGDVNELFRPHSYSKITKKVNAYGKRMRGRPKKSFITI